MEEHFKHYEKTIKKQHSINFTPKYTEEFTTKVNSTLFVAIAVKAVERIGWDLVYRDEQTVEAQRKVRGLGYDQWTEGISATYEYGRVIVKSKSLGSELWDNGRNSKRVKLFIYAFEDTLQSFDRESLSELEAQTKRKNNWEDYIIPDSLPLPNDAKAPNIAIPIIGGLIISLVLGLAVAFISVRGAYIIGLIEVLVAIALSFTMKYFIKLSNYTNFKKLQYLLAAMIVVVFLSNQYFQYEIIMRTSAFDRTGFGEFMKWRLVHGLKLKDLHTGWIGLVISWILQLGLTGLIVYLRIVAVLSKYAIERVPVEVIDFACYFFVKGKSEAEVRKELANKGWSDKFNQDEVMDAIAGVQNINELIRK